MPAKSPHAPRRGGPRRAWVLASGALSAALLLAAAAQALLWDRVCGRLEEGFTTWVANRRAEGWTVAHGAPARGGWPFVPTLTVPGPRLQGDAGTPMAEVEWRAEALALRVHPPRFDRLAVEMPGRHLLRLGGAALPFAADRLDLSLPVKDGAAPREASAEARRLRFGAPAGQVGIGAASLRFETIDGGGPSAPPAVALRVAATDTALPPGLPGASRLGRVVERVGSDLVLVGSFGPSGGDAARQARVWRDGGGALIVRALDVRWGEAAASATGTFRLDDALQPAGAGALRVAGGEALLDAAGEAGLLAPFAATAARIALRALSRAPPEGGPPRAELPLAVRGRSLSLGGVPVARLPALDWGASGN